MNKENWSLADMTEWMKLERLEKNDLPLPQYETEFSAGVDFAACLTRPCKHIPPGKTHKDASKFICCEPTLQGAYTLYHSSNGGHEATSLRRHNVGDTWEDIKQIREPKLLIMPEETVMIPLGFKAEFGTIYALNIHVRSSIGLSGLILANGTGIVDPDYRGELFAAIYNRNRHVPVIISNGQRIVQGVLLQHNQAVIKEGKVDSTVRGEGGFGSTGELARKVLAEFIPMPNAVQEECPPKG